MKILFFGSSPFSLPFLEFFKDRKSDPIVAVVTTPEAPKGRGLKLAPTCVETAARKAGYPVYAPANLKDEALVREWQGLAPEMLLVVSYGKLLPKSVLDMTPLPVNIHPSLLPQYRGPNPILAPILQGDKETGVTVMRISEKMDAGDILKQRAFPLKAQTTGGELEKELIQTGLVLLEEFLKGPAKGTVQKEAEATYTRKTTKEDTHIDWTEDATTIDRKVRAYAPKPRAFFELKGKNIFIESGELFSVEGNKEVPQIGALDREEGSVTLFLPKGRYTLTRVTPEGKGAMRAYDFIQGYRLKAGDPFQ